jgi:hypothetical protein
MEASVLLTRASQFADGPGLARQQNLPRHPVECADGCAGQSCGKHDRFSLAGGLCLGCDESRILGIKNENPYQIGKIAQGTTEAEKPLG